MIDAAARLECAPDLAASATRARQLFAAHVAGVASTPWWTAVVVTASSGLQAERYEAEIRRRRQEGKLPATVRYMVAPDPDGRRIGSGGATLNALRTLALDNWSQERVLVIHSGGDSRRLPQYSVAGKLFSAVPTRTPWGDPSTIFDETLALSTLWANRLRSGLLVASGDVVLTFDAAAVNWDRNGVTGVAMLQPVDVGARHGVYATDKQGRVTSFLQKPSRAELIAAGALIDDRFVALDTGLLSFSAEVAARLSTLTFTEPSGPASAPACPPLIDLYRHVTMSLTGQWSPGLDDSPALHQLFGALAGLPFWCSVVKGDFTHVGSTALFCRFMTRDRSVPALIDSVLPEDAALEPGVVVIECNLQSAVRAESGSALHGLDGLPGEIHVPSDTVIHQLPVRLPDGSRAVTLRVYGVDDDPKAELAAATWFGRPILETLGRLGLDPETVWPSQPASGRTLWNARLYPAVSLEEAWQCARWIMGLSSDYSAGRWTASERLSLASSALLADSAALESARARRIQARWRMSALSLVMSGADVRPLLANPPSTQVLADTAQAISAAALAIARTAPTDAASRYYTAGRFFERAGLMDEAGRADAAAFDWVERSVHADPITIPLTADRWRFQEVSVNAPARLDLGGGWSDTPPFCLDWGGAVLNLAVLLNRDYPIRTTIRRLTEPVVRCVSGQTGAATEYRTVQDILCPPTPGDEFSIPRTALCVAGIVRENRPLRDLLRAMGGGVELRTEVKLPMGSGLGTSSILAAATLRGLLEMIGIEPDLQTLWNGVMRLEQLMTTGGGWQDQAGGGFPGAKLLSSGPGLRQRVRVQPVMWTPEREEEFHDRLLLYYTGIRRVARDLLRQVVGRYLCRETSALQVLHGIKTLALEMSFALQAGEWEHLGSLLDRHWELNQILDPHTTNGPIDELLRRVRPHIHGAKLAGAGGGGFLIMLCRSRESAGQLRLLLDNHDSGARGAVYDCEIAKTGLQVSRK